MDWSQTDALATNRRRNSSKLSLGSTPSSPISTDAADDDDGDAPLTPTERLVDDEDEDDAMLSLNGVLSTDEKDDDDDHALRNSSPSTLSSVPDDFPLSRSSSPVSDSPHHQTDTQVDDAVNNKNDHLDDPPPVEQEKIEQDQEDDQDEDDDEDNQRPPPRRKRKSRRTGAGRRTRKRKSSAVREDPDEEPSVTEDRNSRNGKVSEKFKSDNDGQDSDSASGRTQRKRPKVDSDEQEVNSKDHNANHPTDDPPADPEDTNQPMTAIKEEEDELVGVHPEAAVTNGESKDDMHQDHAEQNKKSTEPDDDEPSNAHGVEARSPAVEAEDGASVAMAAEEDEGEDQAPQPNDQEYQRTHKEALVALTHIEVEFARLRETMYQEKMAELKEEMTLIADGTHPELVSLMEEIETKKRKRMDTAAAWCRFQQLNYRRQFDGFEYQANVHFIHKKNALRRDMINSLNSKRWKLDDERAKLSEIVPLIGVLPERSALARHKKSQKAEALDLRQLQNAIGFPLAPKVFGLAKKDIDDDLEVLGLTHKAIISPLVAQSSIHPTAVGTPERSLTKSDSKKAEHSHSSVDSKHLGYQNGSNVISPHTNSNPIYIQQGKLQYHNHTFNKGDLFTVVDVNAGRYTAKMLTAQDTEILIQRTDGSKTRLPLAMICEGKYQISTKS